MKRIISIHFAVLIFFGVLNGMEQRLLQSEMPDDLRMDYEIRKKIIGLLNNNKFELPPVRTKYVAFGRHAIFMRKAHEQLLARKVSSEKAVDQVQGKSLQATKKRKALVLDKNKEYPVVYISSEDEHKDKSETLKVNKVKSKKSANNEVKRSSARLAAKRRRLHEESESSSSFEYSSDEDDNNENHSEYSVSDNEQKELYCDESEEGSVKKRKKTVKGKHVCSTCETSFATKTVLNRHVKTACELRVRYSCNECKRTFSRKDGVKRHKEQVHKQGKKLFCNKCKFTTWTLSTLKRHKSLKHP